MQVVAVPDVSRTAQFVARHRDVEKSPRDEDRVLPLGNARCGKATCSGQRSRLRRFASAGRLS